MRSHKRVSTIFSRNGRDGRTWWLARAIAAALTWLGDTLLGPVARAARIVADADARLVGIGSPRFPRISAVAASTSDHVGAIINQVRSR